MRQRRTARAEHILALALVSLALYAGNASAAIGDLIGSLTGDLGVTEDQARGGAGALFGLAKQNLSGNDFAKVTDAIPGVTDLLGAAPAAGGTAGMVSGALSSVGGAEGLGGLASLAGSFQELGMGPEMVERFVPIVLDFAKTQGGEAIQTLLKGALI